MGVDRVLGLGCSGRSFWSIRVIRGVGRESFCWFYVLEIVLFSLVRFYILGFDVFGVD